jgi:UDP-N-acetylglucosamine 3-dehydrogenase
MNSLRVALVGAGAMGRNHARVWSDMPGIELVAVADVSFEAARATALRHAARPYDEYRRMFDEQRPDVISIATPTSEHLSVAREAARRGISMLIEKPIADTREAAQQIIDLVAAAPGRPVLAVGHIERYNPAVLVLKDRIVRGELGRIFQLEARRHGPFPARVRDVGVVIDLAVHDLDVLRYVSGVEPVRVFAETERRIHTEHEDLLQALVRMADGSVASLSVNWLTPTKVRELRVVGERGMFLVDYLTQDLYFYENAVAGEDGWDHLRNLRGVSEGSMVRCAIAKKEPLRAELEAFAAAVRGEHSAIVSGQDGLAALELALALVRSGQEQRPIRLGQE